MGLALPLPSLVINWFPFNHHSFLFLYSTVVASLCGDNLVHVLLEMSHLIVAGTTEKPKQRSSTEDNKNEHCDIRWLWSS